MTTHPPRLTVLGREFDGFHRSLTRQLAGLVDLEAGYELMEISDLQALVLDGDGATSGDYDVLMVVTDWLPSLIESGNVQPIEEAFAGTTPDGWPTAWVPALREMQQDAEGNSYGVAYHDGPMLFLYRRDLYEDEQERRDFRARFGYPLLPPDTWEQYLDQARFFDRPERGTRGTVLAGFPDEHNNVYDFLTQLWSRGGELISEDGTSGLASEAAREAVGFLHDLWHVDKVVDPAAVGWDSVQSGIHFAAGEGAMMVNWCGFAALSSPEDSPTHGLIGCAPTPGASGATGSRVTMNAYWVLAIPTGAKDPARSAELIRQLSTHEMDVITAQSGGSATRLDSWADPRVTALAPYYGVLEAAHTSSRSVPVDPRWPAMAAILNDMMTQVIEHAAGPGALVEAHDRLTDLLSGTAG